MRGLAGDKRTDSCIHQERKKTSVKEISAPHRNPRQHKVLIFRIKWCFDPLLHNKCICRGKCANFLLCKEKELDLSSALLTGNKMQVCFEKLSDRGEIRPKSRGVAQSTTGWSTCPSYLSCTCFLGTLEITQWLHKHPKINC